MNVYAIFNAEMYEVYDEQDVLFHSCTSYEELCKWCNTEGHNLLNVTGLEDND